MKILVHCSIFFWGGGDFWHELVLNFILAEKENQKVLFEGCPVHPHCNDPLKAYSVRSIRTDR